MGQTKVGSLGEAFTNIGIGFTINWTINLMVLPVLWNPASPKASAFYIGLVFTAVSLVRQFILRRWFNGISWGKTVVQPQHDVVQSHHTNEVTQ